MGNRISFSLGDYFHPRAFVLSFVALFISMILCVGLVISSSDTEHASDITPTGKIMANVTVAAQEPEPEPEPEPKPEPEPEISPETSPPPPSSETVGTPPPIPAEPEVPVGPLEENETTEPTDTTKLPETESHTEHNPIPEIPVIEDSIAGLSETTPYGPLPIVRATDGLKSFDAYKTPFSLNPTTKGIVSLVMIDYGLSETFSKSAVETIAAPISFVASPYSENLQAKISAARAKGFEMWLAIPTQSSNFADNDTGPLSILSSLNEKQNITRLNTILGRATGYAGVAFINAPDIPPESIEFQKVIQSIAQRGLGATQTNLTDVLVKDMTAPQNIPFIQGNIWLDKDLRKESIITSLTTAENQAIEKGYVVAAFHPSPLIFKLIADWQKSLAAKNIQLAPLTYAIHQHSLIKQK